MTQVSFTQMKDGTYEDYALLAEKERPHLAKVADRLLKELETQGQESLDGYQITRLEHALQSATRAEADGADIDWIVGALLHDIGDGLAPQNHDRFAAEILRPFVREEVAWTIEHHGLFQTFFYGHHYGWDRNARDGLKNDPHYGQCAAFCERWDQSSFDPAYQSKSLAYFAPMVGKVFARPAYDETVMAKGEVRAFPANLGYTKTAAEL